MRYLCVHCDHRFESDQDAVPLRCPSCMRAKGIQALKEGDTAAPVPRGSKRRVRIAGFALLACIAAAVAWFSRPRSAEDGVHSALQPWSERALQEKLAEQNIDVGGLLRLFAQTPDVKRFAERHAAGKDGSFAIADALYAALRARAQAAAFAPWSLAEARSTPVMTAPDTLARLAQDGGRAELYPLELSALLVAALRAREVPAVLAELHSLAGRSAPLDPSGFLGYYGVAVFAEQAGVGEPKLYDVYGGATLPAQVPRTLLTDLEALGAALSLRALHESSYLGDPRKALASSSHALTLAASLPSVRTVRGMVLVGEKMMDQGFQEFRAARELRGDAPRLHNLATLELVMGEGDAAEGLIARALELAPDFAAAEASLAVLQLVRGHADEAEATLQKAERLAPKLSLVQWAYADFALRRGDTDEALSRARRAHALRPSLESKLRLAALLHQLGKYDEMRKLAAELVEAAPAYRKEDVRALLRAVLGPTALEGDAPARAEGATPSSTDLELKLSGEPAGEPSDLALPPSSDEPGKLRLRRPDERLKLKLNP